MSTAIPRCNRLGELGVNFFADDSRVAVEFFQVLLLPQI